jgi:hypothetical protein
MGRRQRSGVDPMMLSVRPVKDSAGIGAHKQLSTAHCSSYVGNPTKRHYTDHSLYRVLNQSKQQTNIKQKQAPNKYQPRFQRT